jgi:type IV secretory pathway VirB10-like protein
MGKDEERAPVAGTPPPATGLSRNMLVVLAALIGITALVAMAYSASFRGATTVRADSASSAPQPQRPGFLDAPPRVRQADSVRVVQARRDSLKADSIALAREESETLAAMAQSGNRREQEGAVRSGSHRETAYGRALMARPLVGEIGGGGERATRESTRASTSETSADSLGPWAVPVPTAPKAAEGSRQREYEGFLRGARAGGGGGDMELDNLPTIRAGTVIPAVLLTEVSSDLPGDIVAQVVRDVYDSRTLRHIVVPKGSRLLGTYDDRIVVGQQRLLVAWTRLALADGRDIALPGLQGTDGRGASGLVGTVDQHVGQQFGDALLLSLLGAGVELSQPSGGGGVLGAPSVGQVAGSALGQQLSEVALELVRRHADVPPTITVSVGSRFEVFVNRALVLPVSE